MNNLVKFGLLAVGAYMLWDKFGGMVATTPAESTVPTTPSDVNISALLDNKRKALGLDSLLSYDQWNYVYNQVRGVYGPNWEDAVPDSTDRAKKYSLQEFLALTVPKGLSGYVRANAWERAIKYPVL